MFCFREFILSIWNTNSRHQSTFLCRLEPTCTHILRSLEIVRDGPACRMAHLTWVPILGAKVCDSIEIEIDFFQEMSYVICSNTAYLSTLNNDGKTSFRFSMLKTAFSSRDVAEGTNALQVYSHLSIRTETL